MWWSTDGESEGVGAKNIKRKEMTQREQKWDACEELKRLKQIMSQEEVGSKDLEKNTENILELEKTVGQGLRIEGNREMRMSG